MVSALKYLYLNQCCKRFSIVFALVKTGNTLQRLPNKIRQIHFYPYLSKHIGLKVYKVHKNLKRFELYRFVLNLTKKIRYVHYFIKP